jgi:hypothetical protein
VFQVYIFKSPSYTWQQVTNNNNNNNRHQGLGQLARSVSRVTAAFVSVSSVTQLFSFLVDCSGMILKRFGVVAFFAGVRASSFCNDDDDDDDDDDNNNNNIS